MQYQGRVYHIQLPGPDQATIQKHWQHWVHNTQDDYKHNTEHQYDEQQGPPPKQNFSLKSILHI